MQRWRSILGLKCPRCSKGNLFHKKGLIVFSEVLEMPERCSHCDLKYHIEPGFWLGAIWTSYPIVVIIELPFLLLAVTSTGNTIWIYFSLMVAALIFAYPLMLRLGRSIWIHLNIQGDSAYK